MGSARVQLPLDPVADLKRRLDRAATPRGRASIAKIRTTVQAWWAEHDLGAHPATVGKRIGYALIEQPRSEDKLAGILVLQEILGDQLRASDLPAFVRLFAAGHLADWTIVDWFCVKVLATLLERDPDRHVVARALVDWRASNTTWQRRAACVAFATIAADGERAMHGVTGMIFTVCATVVWSHDRFDQTAVGWVLRELSRAEPARVVGFFRRYARLMSPACVRYATERFPAEVRSELRAYHRRATTPRAAGS